MRASLRPAGAVLVVTLAACTGGAGWRQPRSQRSWVDSYVLAQQHAAGGRWAAADSVLAAFASAYPESPEAAEARYWRAFYLLDPANPKASPRISAQLLEQYLAERVALLHAAEAATLRRAALALDSLGAAAAGADSVRAGLASREKAAAEEAQKLREELARTQAELERIKKRLASP